MAAQAAKAAAPTVAEMCSAAAKIAGAGRTVDSVLGGSGDQQSFISEALDKAALVFEAGAMGLTLATKAGATVAPAHFAAIALVAVAAGAVYTDCRRQAAAWTIVKDDYDATCLRLRAVLDELDRKGSDVNVMIETAGELLMKLSAYEAATATKKEMRQLAVDATELVGRLDGCVATLQKFDAELDAIADRFTEIHSGFEGRIADAEARANWCRTAKVASAGSLLMMTGIVGVAAAGWCHWREGHHTKTADDAATHIRWIEENRATIEVAKKVLHKKFAKIVSCRDGAVGLREIIEKDRDAAIAA